MRVVLAGNSIVTPDIIEDDTKAVGSTEAYRTLSGYLIFQRLSNRFTAGRKNMDTIVQHISRSQQTFWIGFCKMSALAYLWTSCQERVIHPV